jgi:hypothetical protein
MGNSPMNWKQATIARLLGARPPTSRSGLCWGYAAKVCRFWRKEGSSEALRRAAFALLGGVASRRVVRVYWRTCCCQEEPSEAPLQTRVVEVSAVRLQELDKIAYHPATCLRRRLLAGERCFAAEVGGQLCAFAWLVLGTDHARVAGLRLRPEQCYIYNTRTVRAMRGMALYPHLLMVMCSRLAAEGFREAFLRVDDANRSSCRASEKAGFRVAMSLRSYRLFWMTWERRCY